MPTIKSLFYRVLNMSFTWGKIISRLIWTCTDSITFLGKVLEKPKCLVSIQWKIPLYF
ncbi:unnamed protein product, partial [Vitis vinifera]|uniref:Uncharacterized protein n=1 Tax=Vitis vinifera TaxID=29760 RepID=D7TFW1_VITVI